MTCELDIIKKNNTNLQSLLTAVMPIFLFAFFALAYQAIGNEVSQFMRYLFWVALALTAVFSFFGIISLFSKGQHLGELHLSPNALNEIIDDRKKVIKFEQIEHIYLDLTQPTHKIRFIGNSKEYQYTFLLPTPDKRDALLQTLNNIAEKHPHLQIHKK